MSASSLNLPTGVQPLPPDPDLAQEIEKQKREHLLLDARPPREVNGVLLDAMTKTTGPFWIVGAALGALVITMLVVWTYQMWFGLGVTGLNRTWSPGDNRNGLAASGSYSLTGVCPMIRQPPGESIE